MVASVNSDLYTPFPQGMILEEGPQSSEEGSGLHSPIFGAPFPPHGDIRYHPDIHNAAGILASQFDYNVSPNLNLPNTSSSLLETTTTVELPSSNGHHHHANPTSSYPSNLHPPRNSNHLSDFPLQSPANSRLPPPPSHVSAGDFNFTSSPERRLPAIQPYDRPLDGSAGPSSSGMPMDSNNRSSPPSTERRESSTNTSSREPRKEISMVVIACRQCRARKIRCDSTRPVCNNCVRRSNPCEYDAVPKRRGPDKRPGTRQRSCKKRPADGSAPPPPSKKKRAMASSARAEHDEPSVKVGVKENASASARRTQSSSSSSRPASLIVDTQGQQQQQHSSSPITDFQPSSRMHDSLLNLPSVRRDTSSMYDSDPLLKSFARQLDVNVHRSVQSDMPEKLFPIASPEYSRKSWWDSLLGTYSSTREQSLKEITSDLSFLFSSTSYWLAFINVPVFLRNLYSPEERARMQPSLIYASLAMATLMKSSELELGAGGRNRAVWLRDAAQAELEKAWASQFIDETLAEAALILALFESSAHPQYNPDRFSSALVLLDNIIRTLNLTYIDANDPDVSMFPPHGVPVVNERTIHDPSAKDHGRSKKCSCIPLPHNASLPPDHFSSSWSYTPPWDPTWSAAELRKEECRRLCWSALNLVSSYTSQCAVFQREMPNFYLTNPGNYALLFPGEILERSSGHRLSHVQSSKESVWALYCRSMLLWSFCVRLRSENRSDEDKAEYALEAWSETQAIQDSLDMHVCNLDTALLYMCREYVYNTQMTIAQALRSLQGLDSGSPIAPVFNRKQAEEWLYYQDQVVKRVKMSVHHLGEAQGHLLSRRPFQVSWFASQLAICLSLWNHDHALINALELGKSLVVPIDILNALWPSSLQKAQSDDLRKSLGDACAAAGLSPLLPRDYTLPAILRSG